MNKDDIELNNLNNELPQSELPQSEIVQVAWTSEHEKILIEWADKATCYRWLHSRENYSYNKSNAWFTIPVIIMSTLTGTANFAQEQFPEKVRPLLSMCIGSVNIIAGILTTVQQFLKISELNEAHRVASISWGKFYRNIKVELSKKPTERIPVMQLLKSSKEEFDRLMETSPAISDKTISLFKKTFSGGKIKNQTSNLNDKQKKYQSLKKPEICGTLESTSFSVYKCENEDIISNSQSIFHGISNKLTNAKRNQLIEEIIINFNKEKERFPTTEEVMSEMDYNVGIDIIEKILDKINNNDKENDDDKENYDDNLLVDTI